MRYCTNEGGLLYRMASATRTMVNDADSRVKCSSICPKKWKDGQMIVAPSTLALKKTNLRANQGRWVQLQVSGQIPSPRSGHDVAVIGNEVYLFGGCGGHSETLACLNDMYSFDLDLHQWKAIHTKEAIQPSDRASFGMCTGPIPGTLVIAGGTGVDVNSIQSDAMEFDIKRRSWRYLDIPKESEHSKYYGQTVCSYREYLIIFGGSTGLCYTNELFAYNTITKVWQKLTTSGKKPSPRYKHQATIIGDIMYIVGGGCFKPDSSVIDVYKLNLKTLEWSEVHVMGNILPKSRVAHSCCYDEESGNIFLWGGFTGELKRLQDFYRFGTKTETWHDISPAPGEQSPAARAFHSAVYHEGAIYLFAGANGDVRYNDVWKYEIRYRPPSLSILATHTLRNTAHGMKIMREVKESIPRELWLRILQANEGARQLYPAYPVDITVTKKKQSNVDIDMDTRTT